MIRIRAAGIACVMLLIVLQHPVATTDGLYKNKFVITDISSDKLYPSDIQIINITIRNNWDKGVVDVYATADNEANGRIMIKGETRKFIGRINSSEEKIVTYQVYVDDKTEKGVYTLPIDVSWRSDLSRYGREFEKGGVRGGTFNETLYVGVYVEGLKLPEIEIMDIVLDPAVVKPGDIVTISYKIKNVGSTEILSLTNRLLLEFPLYHEGLDTKRYIPSLKPDEIRSINFTVGIDSSAERKKYTITSFLEYHTTQKIKKLQTNTIQTVVGEGPSVQSPTLRIHEISMEPQILTPGTEGKLLIRIENIGQETAKDAKILIYGGGDLLAEPYQFVGTVAPNSTKTATFNVHVDPKIKSSTYGLNIDVKFEDIGGTEYVVSRLWGVPIFPSKSLVSRYMTILIGLIVLSAIIVSSILILKITSSESDIKE